MQNFTATKAPRTGKIKVYGAGGTGINITKLLDQDVVDVVYVDSSTSNITDQDNMDQVYLIEGMDGAGKNRAKTYENFNGSVEPVLITHKPSEDLNVVIGSLSGGTGSIIAPMLVKELISQGKSVIVVAVATTASGVETRNCIGTLHTYNNIVRQTQKPVAMFYAGQGRREGYLVTSSLVDAEVVKFVETLSVITDKKRTTGADSEDIHNFINYTNVSKTDPMITIVSHVENTDENTPAGKDSFVVSSILMSNDPETELIGIRPEYLAQVVVTDKDWGSKSERIDAVAGQIPHIIGGLEEMEQENQNTLRTNRINKVEAKDAIDDGFVVL